MLSVKARLIPTRDQFLTTTLAIMLRSKAIHGVRWGATATVAMAGTDLLRNIVLARFLSPADFGMMAMAMVVVGFVQMYTDLGIGAAIIYRQTATRDELSSLYWLNVFSGWFVFVLVWITVPVMVHLYHEPRLAPLLRTIDLAFLIAPLGSQFEILLQKELSFKYLARRDMAGSLAQTISAIVCAILGFGAWAIVYGYLIGTAVKTGLLLPVGLRRFRPCLRFKLSDLRGYLTFGLWQLGERTACYLGQRSDQILIGSLLGTEALGYYSFAFNLAVQPLSRLNPVVSKVAFPVFSQVQNDVARLKRGYMTMVGILSACNAPLLVGLAATAPWGVPLLFGAKWAPSIVLVEVLSFVTLLRSINNPIGAVQCAKGRADLGFGWQLLTLISSSAAVYLSCKSGRLIMVALGLLMLQIALAVLLYALLVRPLLGKCIAEYSNVAFKPTLIAMVMGLTVLLVPYVLNLRGVAAFATQILIGTAIYVLLLRMFHPLVFAECKTAFLYR